MGEEMTEGEGRTSASQTRLTSQASWRAMTADDWNRRSVLKSCAISRTNRWKGSFRMSSSVDLRYTISTDQLNSSGDAHFWYRRISRRATVPGLYL